MTSNLSDDFKVTYIPRDSGPSWVLLKKGEEIKARLEEPPSAFGAFRFPSEDQKAAAQDVDNKIAELFNGLITEWKASGTLDRNVFEKIETLKEDGASVLVNAPA